MDPPAAAKLADAADRQRAHRRGRGAVHLQPHRGLRLGLPLPRRPRRRHRRAGRVRRHLRSASCGPSARSTSTRARSPTPSPSPPGWTRWWSARARSSARSSSALTAAQAARHRRHRAQLPVPAGPPGRQAGAEPRPRSASAGRSLVTAAYDLLAAEIGALAGRRVLVVGAGSMAGLAARTAAAAGADVTCVNRTLARAQRLAASVGGRAVPLAELPSRPARDRRAGHLHRGAGPVPRPPTDLAGTPVRGVVDLALPADVAPDVTELGIALVNLDRLVAEQLDPAGAAEVEAARDLVRSEVGDFLGLRRAAQVAPTVVALRSMASEVVAAEMQPARRPAARAGRSRARRGPADRPPGGRQAAAPADRTGPGAGRRPGRGRLRRRAAGAVRPGPAGRRGRDVARTSAVADDPRDRAHPDRRADRRRWPGPRPTWSARCWPRAACRRSFVGITTTRRRRPAAADRDRRHRGVRRRGPRRAAGGRDRRRRALAQGPADRAGR